MTISRNTQTTLAAALGLALVVALFALAFWPGAGKAASRTETLRFFTKEVSSTVAHPGGSLDRGDVPPAEVGDVLDVTSLDYAGDHESHAPRWSASQHMRCEFFTPEPDCVTHVAIGGSLLIFDGYPGTLIDGTGRYQDATGRVLSTKEAGGGSDIVLRIWLHGEASEGAPAATPEPAAPTEPPWERALRLRGEAMNRMLAR